MCVIAVGSPCAPVVAQNTAGFKGGLAGRTLGAQTADGARLVVDCFFCAGRGIFQVLLCCRFSGEVMCIHFAVFAAAILADCFLRAGGCAARAVVRFRVACISGADAGMCVIAVGSPCAPVVTEDVAGCEGGFIGCALGAQTADGAGFVVDCFFCAGRGRFQVLLLCRLRCEVVRLQRTVLALANLADRLGSAGGFAAGAGTIFPVVGVTLADTGVAASVAVLRPCAPVVAQRGIFCGKRIGVIGAYFTARTG